MELQETTEKLDAPEVLQLVIQDTYTRTYVRTDEHICVRTVLFYTVL